MIPLKFKSSIFFDIDGVLIYLRDEAKRAHAKQNWGAFMTIQLASPVIDNMVKLARALALDHNIIVTTARSEEYRESTHKQLRAANIPYEALFMRPIGCLDSSPILKLKMYGQFLSDFEADNEVSLIIDDREDVVNAFTFKGVPALLYKGAL